MHETDVILVGSGQAAIPLATRFAEAGKSVVLFEAGGARRDVHRTPAALRPRR